MSHNRDQEHLNILAIFHYVVSILFGLGALFPTIYMIIGIVIVNGQFETENQQGPPAAVGWMLIGMSCFGILLGMTFAACIALAGRKLHSRTGYIFCMIIAGIECFFMPIGTVLGIFTILVLLRPTVKALFDGTQPSNDAPPIYNP